MTSLTTTYADSAIAGGLITYSIDASFSDTAAFTETWTIVFINGSGGLADNAAAKAVPTFQMVYNLSLTESAQASAQQATSFDVTQTLSAIAHDSITVAVAQILSEKGVAHDSISTAMIYNSVNLSSSARGADVVTTAKGELVTEHAIARDSITVEYVANVSLVEHALASLGFGSVGGPVGLLSDNAFASEAFTFGFVFNPIITELAIASEIVNFDTGFTTWAINTRTNAVTQYSNWGSFNSFAAMGRKYLAADADGLYELNGSQDVTAPVIADMQGGFFEPNEGMLAGFKGCYIAARGQGNWRLVLTTGDLRTFTYERVSNPGLMKTKFEIGKGLRSTYFGWELKAMDGQDFDFDRIEFIPMRSGRRI